MTARSHNREKSARRCSLIEKLLKIRFRRRRIGNQRIKKHQWRVPGWVMAGEMLIGIHRSRKLEKGISHAGLETRIIAPIFIIITHANPANVLTCPLPPVTHHYQHHHHHHHCHHDDLPQPVTPLPSHWPHWPVLKGTFHSNSKRVLAINEKPYTPKAQKKEIRWL